MEPLRENMKGIRGGPEARMSLFTFLKHVRLSYGEVVTDRHVKTKPG